MNPTALNRTYYPALDGLRGIAILLVILYHNFGFVQLFQLGWLGVDLFFVLSGFLITEILIQTRGTENWLKNFYVRRILRIFPLYYLCLFVFLYVVPVISPFKQDVSYYLKHQGWLWVYLQNWLYIKDTFTSTNILHHFWSLAVEEQFYIVWPFIILLVKDIKKLIFIILGLLIAVILFRLALYPVSKAHPSVLLLYTFSRIDGLCIGSCLALIRFLNKDWIFNHINKIVFILAGINLLFFLSTFLLSLNLPYIPLLGYPSFALIFGLIVYYAVLQKKLFLFNSKPLKFLGKISYSLYVFHWPVYIILFPYITSFISNLFSSLKAAQVTSASICVLIAIVLSVISFHTIERYFMQLKNKLA